MNGRILIVDDDDDTLAMLATFVRGEGHEVLLASDGGAAIAMFNASAPDLVLLDAVMPGIDGFETCRRIKSHQNAANVPVIFMTGLSDTQHVVMGLAAGGVDYVTKPLVLAELGARIQVHLVNASKARSAMSGLEGVGACLFGYAPDTGIGWTTPRASQLVAALDDQSGTQLLTDLERIVTGTSDDPVRLIFAGDTYEVKHLGPSGGGEDLFEASRSSRGNEPKVLQDVFALTPREAEVLLWTARGKSNKDMSEILNISARTVNKHLEQIFIKIGVENRASAAAVATRALLS